MIRRAARADVDEAARAAACEGVALRIEAEAIETVRVGWCDLHGVLRGKTLVASALAGAFESGVGMVSTILLKDTSDRTAYRIFEPGVGAALPGFGFANNLVLRLDPTSFRVLPWAPSTGWVRGEACFEDGAPVPIDTRRVLQAALARLARRPATRCSAASRSSSTSTDSPRAMATARSTRRAPRGRASRPR